MPLLPDEASSPFTLTLRRDRKLRGHGLSATALDSRLLDIGPKSDPKVGGASRSVFATMHRLLESPTWTERAAIVAVWAANYALVNRRDPTSGLLTPILRAVGISLVTVALLFLATQLPTLRAGMLTVPLTPLQWLTCAGLAAMLPIVVEIGKVIRRRGSARTRALDPEHALAPSRALSAVQM